MKYYYYRFLNTFFQQGVIRNMKHIPLFGYQFIVIYLELCSIATESQGILKVPRMGEVPYIASLAKDIGEDAEIVGQAFTYFLSNGLIEKIEDENSINIFIPYVMNNTGTSSKRADQERLRYHHKKHELLGSPQMAYKKYGLCKKVELTDAEYEDLKVNVKELKSIIENIDLDKAMGKTFKLSDYELIIERSKKLERGIK